MKPYANKWKFIKKPLFKIIGCNHVSKKAIRRHAKKEINRDLEYYDYYHIPFYEQPYDFEDYQEIKKDSK